MNEKISQDLQVVEVLVSVLKYSFLDPANMIHIIFKWKNMLYKINNKNKASIFKYKFAKTYRFSEIS